jgi:hypothetical protein
MVTPKGSMSTEAESLQVSVLPYRCSICPPLVTRQISNLAVLANFNTQNAFLFPVHAIFRHDCQLAVKPASMLQRLVHTHTHTHIHTKLGDSLPTDMLLSAVPVCLGWCAADFGSSGGTYELPCILPRTTLYKDTYKCLHAAFNYVSLWRWSA